VAPTAEEIAESNSIQDKIAEVAKNAIRPFFMNKHISKEEYKYILKKVVGKVVQKNYTNTRRNFINLS
jgi:hypothetical protein